MGRVRVSLVGRDAQCPLDQLGVVSVRVGEAVHGEQQRVRAGRGQLLGRLEHVAPQLFADIGDPRLECCQVSEAQREIPIVLGSHVARQGQELANLGGHAVGGGSTGGERLLQQPQPTSRTRTQNQFLDLLTQACRSQRIAELQGELSGTKVTLCAPTGVGGEQRGALERLEGDHPPTPCLSTVRRGLDLRGDLFVGGRRRRHAVPHLAVGLVLERLSERRVHRHPLGRRSRLVDR